MKYNIEELDNKILKLKVINVGDNEKMLIGVNLENEDIYFIENYIK